MRYFKYFLMITINFIYINIANADFYMDPRWGTVVIDEVVDGDTVKLHYFRGVGNITVRLSDIDCYETKAIPRAHWQAEYYKKSIGEVLKLGNQSKIILKQVLNQYKDNIYLKSDKKDIYGRTLGRLYIGKDENNMSINEFMLLYGGCEVYVDRSKTY